MRRGEFSVPYRALSLLRCSILGIGVFAVAEEVAVSVKVSLKIVWERFVSKKLWIPALRLLPLHARIV